MHVMELYLNRRGVDNRCNDDGGDLRDAYMC